MDIDDALKNVQGTMEWDGSGSRRVLVYPYPHPFIISTFVPVPLLASKPVNVNGEVSTSQPNANKEPSSLKPNNKGKDVSDLQEINGVLLQNSFYALIGNHDNHDNH
nr:hypothetical protein [Tanacetum cinerariifolium]